MNLRNIAQVFKKEVLETLRDRRTLILMIVVPIFSYPILLVVGQQAAMFGLRQMEEAPVRVVAQGATGEALAILSADSSLSVAQDDDAGIDMVGRGEADLLIRFEEYDGVDGQIMARLYFDGSRDRSSLARRVAARRLDEWGDSLLAHRLAARDIPASFVEPVAVADSSVASAERMGGYALGRIIPMILILMTLLGAFYPAIDLSAGEKERGTLEPLLTTPVPPRDIVAGKFLTIALIALGAATLNLVSMLLTFQFVAMQFNAVLDMSFRVPWSAALLVLLVLIPLAVLFSALFLGMALRAQSFKEAQNTLTPIQLAAMLPMVLPMIPGISFTYLVAAIPIGGVAMLFRELMVGEASLGPALVALVTTVVYAGLALRFAANSFGREEVLFGTGAAAVPASGTIREQWRSWRDQSRSVPRAGEAFAFVALIALLYFYVGGLLQVRAGESGLFLSQILLLATPAVALVVFGPYRAKETLALRAPAWRDAASGILIATGGIPVAWLLVWLQSLFLDVPQEFLTAMEELIRADTPAEVVWLLVLIAVTPAICEELVFRGVLLHGLASENSPGKAVVMSALIFGAFHLSTATAIRLLPTAWLGLLLGLVVWRTRSLYIGMAMHFVNNAAIILIMAVPSLQSQLFGTTDAPRWTLVLAGGMLLLAGFRLLPQAPLPDQRSAEPATLSGRDGVHPAR